MMWQYAAVGLILVAVAGIIAYRICRTPRTRTPENPFCAGCALAKTCKSRCDKVK